MTAAIGELSRLASMGSDSAAATLEYMCLRDPHLPGVDHENISSLCQASAIRSYAYAQYVVACREYQLGNFREYSRWLHRAARRNFPPAIGDVARALLAASGTSRRYSKFAKRFLGRAIERGHVVSALHFLRACKDGKFGGGMSVMGYIAFPIALLFSAAMCRVFPFSVSLFSHPFGSEKPLFRQLRGNRI
jgi:hypothetical protein